MARIDSILAIVLSQGANELRVGSGREPKMLAHGAPKRLLIPETSDETLRELLGEILSPERDATLRANGRVDVVYETEGHGAFQVSLTGRASGGIDAVFLRSAARSARAVAVAPPAAAPAATTVAYESSASLSSSASGSHAAAAPAAVASHVPAADATGIAELVARALASRASDLHVVDGDVPAVRVDGRIIRLDDAPIVDVVTAFGLDAGSAARVARGEALELALDLEGGVRGRAQIYRASTGNAATVRFLAHSAPTIASLNMPVPLDDVIDLPHGLVLVCGATGSGKSSTLAALSQEALRRRSVVLVTLEDPIEYVLESGSSSIVRQRQIGRDASSFESGLRDALREDPDILVVGEMRDAESIALALTAAETGHLVLATLHCGSAASAIERIVDSYPEGRQHQIRGQVADALRVVIAQKLVPRARGTGRLPAVELLRVNHAAASLIREGKTAQIPTVLQSGRGERMISLERCLADRVQAGEVKREHAKAAANDLEALSQYLGR